MTAGQATNLRVRAFTKQRQDSAKAMTNAGLSVPATRIYNGTNETRGAWFARITASADGVPGVHKCRRQAYNGDVYSKLLETGHRYVCPKDVATASSYIGRVC